MNAAEATERDRLAREHLPLAHRRAQRLAFETGLPVDEARSAALLGLAEAIDRYRPELGSFAPFASRTIEGRVRNAARDWRWRRRGERLPGRELVGDDELLALVPDTLTSYELAEARTDITRALAALTAVERQVVLLHGKMGYTFPVVGELLDLSEDHCRYLWRRALARMRASLGAQESAGAASSPSCDESPAPDRRAA